MMEQEVYNGAVEFGGAFDAGTGAAPSNMGMRGDAGGFDLALSVSPAGSVEDIRLSFPESVQVDQGVQQRFAELCVAEGFSPKQAQALVDWQIKADEELRSGLVQRGTEQLRQSWGARYEENRGKAMQAFSVLDRRMGGRLAQSLGGREMALSPDMVEALYVMSGMISEDAVGAGNAGAWDNRPETAEQMYAAMFKNAY